MKKILIAAGMMLIATGVMFAAKPKVDRAEQVLLTIDNVPVTVGEFEYLYHKNNAQQLVPQTIDEYLEMFINYKLKVADAQEAGLDTTATFKQEFDGYARELAVPYLYDAETENQMVTDVYNRLGEVVEVSHILIPYGQNEDEKAMYARQLDSIRTAIVNGDDFGKNAQQFTMDRSTVNRGGYMGFIQAMQYPYQFEDMAYNTPVGEISPVFTTPYGHHIVKVHSRHDSPGYVKVRHILKLTNGLSDSAKAQKKQEIDSLRTLAIAGADFAALAQAESDDHQSALNGGLLPEFSTGEMVPEFEKASFELAEGEISPVIETAYGYHIIKGEGKRAKKDFDEVAPRIRSMFQQDGRINRVRQAKVNALREKYNVQFNRPALAMVESVIRNSGGFNEGAKTSLGAMPAPLATFEGGEVKLDDVVAGLAVMGSLSPESAYKLFLDKVNYMVDAAVVDLEIAQLPTVNSDYRNLLNEYRDGILLFDISDRKVWSRAKDDVAGLSNWFETHRDRYTWEKPKFRGYIIFASNDSVMGRVNGFLADRNLKGKNLAEALKQLCGNNVRVERVIASEGENAIIDYLGFNGPKPTINTKWPVCQAYEAEVLDAPATVSDDRGAITADYQAELESQWIKELRGKHKVKVNKKVLKTVI